MKKCCTSCDVVLDDTNKYQSPSSRTISLCIACCRARQAKYYAKDPQRYKENGKRWKEAHPERVKAYTAKWVDGNREHYREYQRVYQKARRARLNQPEPVTMDMPVKALVPISTETVGKIVVVKYD